MGHHGKESERRDGTGNILEEQAQQIPGNCWKSEGLPQPGISHSLSRTFHCIPTPDPQPWPPGSWPLPMPSVLASCHCRTGTQDHSSSSLSWNNSLALGAFLLLSLRMSLQPSSQDLPPVHAWHPHRLDVAGSSEQDSMTCSATFSRPVPGSSTSPPCSW